MHEFFVFEAVRLVGVLAHAAFAFFFVGLEVAVADVDVAVAFEGDDVGGDAVEEPAVVADDDDAAGEVDDGFFQGAQGVDIEIVSRFVEQQHVAAAAEELGQVDAVAFAAGKIADFFLLIGAGEVEPGQVGAGIDFAAAHFDEVGAAGDFLVDRVVGLEGVAILIDVAELDRFADFDFALIGLLLAGDQAEERGFAGAVGADDADDAARGQAEGEIFEQQIVAVGFADVFHFDDERAEVFAGGNLNFEFLIAFLEVLLGHLLVGADAGFAFGLTGAGGEADPFQFALQGFLAGAGLFFFHFQAGFFLLQPRGIVAFPGDAAAAVEFENPLGDVI